MKKIIFKTLKKIYKKYQQYEQKYGWFGDYNNWESAQSETTGYDSDLILNKVKTALLKVKNGEAVYERDSVNFDEIQYSWGALSGLLYAAQENKNRLTILDFGGSLGSSYYQNRLALKNVTNLSWNIVEQAHFVKSGIENFSNQQLHFYETIESYHQANPQTDVLFLSSVIQYIEKPYDLIEILLKLSPSIIIIDITTFTHEGRDIITIQKVPPFIYDASYPCWFFDQEKFFQFFIARGYYKMGDWKMPYEINFGFHAGVILTKTKV